MSESHTLIDPFLGKKVEISSRLVDRLRGKYACGPTLSNGEPEFGWRQHETPPVQHEAADEIERIRVEFEIVRTASRLFEQASNDWMERALKAEAALAAVSNG